MAKKSTSNGPSISKLGAVREILKGDPNATGSTITEKAKAKYGIEIDPKMAATYRYHIFGKQRRKNRKAVKKVQAATPSVKDDSDGVDHLLRAARKLGWQRVNEIVQGVLNAPT